MAKRKQDESGAAHFAESARVSEQTSSSSRFSTINPLPKANDLDGQSYEEVRGKPNAEVKPQG